jgi:hypothetical protein
VDKADQSGGGEGLLTLRRRRIWACLTLEQKENIVLDMFTGRRTMLKIFIEEAAALASIVLFVGMVAVWAQVLPQL